MRPLVMPDLRKETSRRLSGDVLPPVGRRASLAEADVPGAELRGPSESNGRRRIPAPGTAPPVSLVEPEITSAPPGILPPRIPWSRASLDPHSLPMSVPE